MEKQEKRGLFHPERLRWFRDVSLLGAGALAGAGIVLPQYQEVLFLGAGANAAQAIGAEALRMQKIKPKDNKENYALAA